MKNLILAVAMILGLGACDGTGLGTGGDATGVDGGGVTVCQADGTNCPAKVPFCPPEGCAVCQNDGTGCAPVAVADAGAMQPDSDPRPCTLYNWVVNGDYPNGILVCATHEPWQPCNDVLPCTARLDAGVSTDVMVNPDLADLCGPLAVTVTVLDSGIHMCGPLPLDAGTIDAIR